MVTIVETHGMLHIVKEDPDDDIILESAVDNGADTIISGDSHLLRVGYFKNVRVMSPSEFLQ